MKMSDKKKLIDKIKDLRKFLIDAIKSKTIEEASDILKEINAYNHAIDDVINTINKELI